MNLSEIHQHLNGMSEDARFEAWLFLYQSRSEVCLKEIEAILADSDPALKILFTRFLSRIDQERAIRYLIRLLQEHNPLVFDAARKAFEKNRYNDKYRLLIPLINSPSQRLKIYAINSLGSFPSPEAIPPLIRILEATKHDYAPEAVELKARILGVLRFLPDKRLIQWLQGFAKDEQMDTRKKAILALGAMHEVEEGTVRKELIKSLKDPEPSVRQAALWSLARNRLRRDLPFLLKLSLSDPDSAVRQESLSGLQTFHSKKTVRHLLKLLSHEKNRYVALKIESTLLATPKPVLIRGLKSELRGSSDKMRAKILLWLAQLQTGSPSMRRFLTRALKKEQSDMGKLPLIEALGALEDLKGVPELIPYLRKSPVLSYAAMGALLKIWRARGHFPVVPYLSDPDFSALSKQIILKQLLPKPEYWSRDAQLIETLAALTRDPNLNIRYLSVEALAVVKEGDFFDLFLELAPNETDASFVRALYRHLVALILSKPERVFAVCQAHANDPQKILLILSLLMTAPLLKAQAENFVPLLIDLAFNAPSDGVLESVATVLTGWIRAEKLKAKRLFTFLESEPRKETLLNLIVRQLKSNPPAEMELPEELVAAWMGVDSPQLVHTVIDWVAMSRSRQMVPVLASFLGDRSKEAYHYQASRALNRLISLKE